MDYKIIFCIGLAIIGISFIAIIVTFFKCNVKELVYDLIGKRSKKEMSSASINYKIKESNKNIQIRETKSNVGETGNSFMPRKRYESEENNYFHASCDDFEKTGLIEEVPEKITDILDDIGLNNSFEGTGMLYENIEEQTGLIEEVSNEPKHIVEENITGVLEINKGIENPTGILESNIVRNKFEQRLDDENTGVLGVNIIKEEVITGVLEDYRGNQEEDDDITGLLEVNENEDCTGMLNGEYTGLVNENFFVEEVRKELNILVIHSNVEIE